MSSTSVLKYIRDSCFPFSIKIENVGLTSEGENGIILTRRKYNRVKKEFTLHYSSLTVEEFELLSYFYEIECSFGLRCFFWRYPVLVNDSDSSDIGHSFQNKVFYVYMSKFSFKAVSYNNYQGDVILSEM